MKNKNLLVYIIIIAIMIFIGIYAIINNLIKSEYSPDYTLDDFYIIPNKKIEVNGYTVSTVNDEDMVNTYFNIYTLMLFEDIDKAYSKLNEDYRNKKYPDINSFKNYVSSITDNFTELPQISEYYIDNKDEKTVYKIIDKNGNKYIFVVTAVMEYEVYFDENTVAIE